MIIGCNAYYGLWFRRRVTSDINSVKAMISARGIADLLVSWALRRIRLGQ